MEAHELKPLRRRRSWWQWNKRAEKAALRKTGWRAKREAVAVSVHVPVKFNHRRTQSKTHTHAGEIGRRLRAEDRRRGLVPAA
jgi:hypothetical protein